MKTIIMTVRTVVVIAILSVICCLSVNAAEYDVSDIGPAIAYIDGVYVTSDDTSIADVTVDIDGTSLVVADMVDYVCESPLGTPIMCDGENIIEFLPIEKYEDLDIQRVWVNGDYDDLVYIVASSELRYADVPSAIELLGFECQDSIGTPICMTPAGIHEGLFFPAYETVNVIRTTTFDGIVIYAITPVQAF